MRVDSEGTLYIASGVGLQVFDKNGVTIKIISIPETPSNVAFGGKDLKTLFITAGTSLYSMPVVVSGNPLYTSVPAMETLSSVVFPNPTRGLLNISLTKYQSLHIYTISGQEVLSGISLAHPTTIDLGSLQNGCYIVRIEADKVVYSSKVFLLK